MKTLTYHSILLLLAGLISLPQLIGCGGSEMNKLKRLAAARKRAGGGKKNDEDDPPAKKKSKDKVEKSASNEDTKLDGKKTVSSAKSGNLTKLEKQNLKSAKVDDVGFAAFKQRTLATFAEKEKTLTPVARYEAVARAFGEYVRLHRGFPPKAHPYRKPTLSWRVAILPYLGYKELHAQFDSASRYNSPLNRRLIELMPPEYKTMERKRKQRSLLRWLLLVHIGKMLPLC